MKDSELSSETARRWWGSLTRTEKRVVRSLTRPLITNQKYNPTAADRVHQTHASTKAANMGLLGEMLSPTNTSKSDKRLGLAFLYLRIHQKFASTIYDELFGENLLAVKDLWTAFNDQDSFTYASLVSRDCIWHRQDGSEANGRKDVQESIEFYIQAFSDIWFDTTDMVATGDRVVTQWKASGTHDGVFLGIPPTGRGLTVVGSTIHRLKGGEVVEMWDYWDLSNLLAQIGMLEMKVRFGGGDEVVISIAEPSSEDDSKSRQGRSES